MVRKKTEFLATGVTFRQALVIWCVVTKSWVTLFLTHGYRWLKRKCKSGGVILKMAAAQGEYILPIFPKIVPFLRSTYKFRLPFGSAEMFQFVKGRYLFRGTVCKCPIILASLWHCRSNNEHTIRPSSPCGLRRCNLLRHWALLRVDVASLRKRWDFWFSFFRYLISDIDWNIGA